MDLKDTLKQSFLKTLNETLGVIKSDVNSEKALDLADFAADYAKDTGSLLYCYQFITEEEYDLAVARTQEVLKVIKAKAKTKVLH
jgi:hypothetical protein